MTEFEKLQTLFWFPLATAIRVCSLITIETIGLYEELTS